MRAFVGGGRARLLHTGRPDALLEITNAEGVARRKILIPEQL